MINYWMKNYSIISCLTDVTEIRIPKKVGRPTLSYENLADKTKKKRDLSIERKLNSEQSYNIVKKKLKSEGNLNASKLIDILRNPEESQVLYKSYQDKSTTELTEEEALALKLATRLSCEDYRILRRTALKKNNHFFPPLAKVLILN